jgi:PIN domain nuclease of toxin-antitoxin system
MHLEIAVDTHAFLWFVLDDAKLSLPGRQAIESVGNDVLISPASYWEIAIKISLGKYRLNGSFERFWDAGMRRNNITVLPIEIPHADRRAAMAFHHKDPFDRLVIAQALVEGLHLVSADQRFDAYGVSRVW